MAAVAETVGMQSSGLPGISALIAKKTVSSQIA